MTDYKVRKEDINIPDELLKNQEHSEELFVEQIRKNIRAYVDNKENMILEEMIKHKGYREMFYETRTTHTLMFTKEDLRKVFEFYNKYHDRVEELEKAGDIK